jgi:hypothetical protein
VSLCKALALSVVVPRLRRGVDLGRERLDLTEPSGAEVGPAASVEAQERLRVW